MEKAVLEEGSIFSPRFDANGLIPCIITSAHNGVVLMLAYMNEQSLKLSLETGQAHYWSRSRQEIWHKGATSGNVQSIKTMRTDCDQDCLWISVEMPENSEKKETSCHTGRQSCFYRQVSHDGKTLSFDESK